MNLSSLNNTTAPMMNISTTIQNDQTGGATTIETNDDNYTDT
jgi:hypothetical protein